MKPEPSGKITGEKKPTKRRSNAAKAGEEEESAPHEGEGSDAIAVGEDIDKVKIGAELGADEGDAARQNGGEKKSKGECDDAPSAKKTKRSPPKPKASAKKTTSAAVAGKNTASSRKPRKKKVANEALVSAEDISDSDSDSDDKPLAEIKKPEKPAFPSDDEIVEKVKGILDGADLDKITMKIVCRNIYDMYPDQDMTGKKDFIKTTVKKLIS